MLFSKILELIYVRKINGHYLSLVTFLVFMKVAFSIVITGRVCDSVHRGGCMLQILGGEGVCFKFSGGVCSKFSGGGGVSALNFRGGVSAPNFGGGVCSKFFWGGGVSAPNFGGGGVPPIFGIRSPFGRYASYWNASLLD